MIELLCIHCHRYFISFHLILFYLCSYLYFANRDKFFFYIYQEILLAIEIISRHPILVCVCKCVHWPHQENIWRAMKGNKPKCGRCMCCRLYGWYSFYVRKRNRKKNRKFYFMQSNHVLVSHCCCCCLAATVATATAALGDIFFSLQAVAATAADGASSSSCFTSSFQFFFI